MTRLGVLALSVLLFAGMARAEETITPQRLALAHQVMELNGSVASYANYDKTLDAVVAQLRRSMPDLDDATIADIHKIAVEEFTAAKPQMLEDIAKIYARHFSEAQLRALIAFYGSDTGRHLAAELPALTAESLEVNAPYNQKFMARLRDYLAGRLAAQQKSPGP